MGAQLWTMDTGRLLTLAGHFEGVIADPERTPAERRCAARFMLAIGCALGDTPPPFWVCKLMSGGIRDAIEPVPRVHLKRWRRRPR
jgi:hypothetical protein